MKNKISNFNKKITINNFYKEVSKMLNNKTEVEKERRVKFNDNIFELYYTNGKMSVANWHDGKEYRKNEKRINIIIDSIDQTEFYLFMIFYKDKTNKTVFGDSYIVQVTAAECSFKNDKNTTLPGKEILKFIDLLNINLKVRKSMLLDGSGIHICEFKNTKKK